MKKIAVAYGHRSDGITVIGATQADEAAPLRFTIVVEVAQSHFEPDLNRCRPVIGIEHFV